MFSILVLGFLFISALAGIYMLLGSLGLFEKVGDKVTSGLSIFKEDESDEA